MGPQGPPYGSYSNQPRPNEIGPQGGPMMPPNVSMMPNNNMGYNDGSNGPSMMNNNNMMGPNQNMMSMGPNQMCGPQMGNQGPPQMHGNSMMPPPARPSAPPGGMMPNRETVAVQDPFSDTPASMSQPYRMGPGGMQYPNMSQAQPPVSQQPMGSQASMNSYGYNRPPIPPSSSYPGSGSQYRPDSYHPQPDGGMGPNRMVTSQAPPVSSQSDGGFSGQVPINRVPNQFSQQQGPPQQPSMSDSKYVFSFCLGILRAQAMKVSVSVLGLILR